MNASDSALRFPPSEYRILEAFFQSEPDVDRWKWFHTPVGFGPDATKIGLRCQARGRSGQDIDLFCEFPYPDRAMGKEAEEASQWLRDYQNIKKQVAGELGGQPEQ